MKTTKNFLMLLSVTLALFALLLFGCEKPDEPEPEPEPEITLPTIATAAVSDITTTTAICGGDISSDGGSEITLRGICWSEYSEPDVNSDSKTEDGIGTGKFTSSMTKLIPNTTYYVRAYAQNSFGLAYGDTVSFKTLDEIGFNPLIVYGSMTDQDGNTYKTVTIGTQVWMAENLRTTKYRDGSAIDEFDTNNTAYDCYSPISKYGFIYDFYALIDNRNLCPTGWHAAMREDWQTLIDYLGGFSTAGGKLKEVGTTHWEEPNEGANNSSGFTALPTITYYPHYHNRPDLYYTNGTNSCRFWAADTTDKWNPQDWARYIRLECGSESVGLSGTPEDCMYNVRCVKD